MKETIPVLIEGTSITKVFIDYASDKGMRSYQEDHFAVSVLKNGGAAAVVADGMGGMANGAEISTAASEDFIEAVSGIDTEKKPVHILFEGIINKINRSLSNKGGGSTLCGVLCCPKGIYWCSVGDSRLYLIREGKPYQVTQDGDYMNELLDSVISGEMSFETATSDAQKDSLCDFIGASGHLVPDCNVRPLVPEMSDRLFLCSDGVYNALPEAELARIIMENPCDPAEKIIKRVLEMRFEGQDNITALTISFG